MMQGWMLHPTWKYVEVFVITVGMAILITTGKSGNWDASTIVIGLLFLCSLLMCIVPIFDRVASWWLVDVQGYFIYNGQNDNDIPGDVIHVIIHPSVKAIDDSAFYNRRLFTIAILNDGLEEMGERAFSYSVSLEQTVIPNAIKAIRKGAFNDCSELTTVTRGNGLDEIGA